MVDFLWMPKSGTMTQIAERMPKKMGTQLPILINVMYKFYIFAEKLKSVHYISVLHLREKNKHIWIYRFPAVQTSAWLWWRSITSNNMYIRVLDGWKAYSLCRFGRETLLCFSSLELGWIYKVSKLFCALFLWNIYVGVNLKSHKLFCALSQKSEWRWEFIVWRVMLWVEWIPVQHICYIFIGYQIMLWSVV